MNKIRIGQTAAALLAVVASALAVSAGAATAATTVTAATTADPAICTGYGEDNMLKDGPIKNLTTEVVIGRVELCQRWDTGTLIRWTNVRLGYTMNPGDRANGRIVYRNYGETTEHVPSTCHHGGTGQIFAPDRTCSTGGTPWVKVAENRADVYIYNVNDRPIATGTTVWVR